MAVFRVEKNKGYTVMSNHHLRNKELSLKAKGLLSQMLSLPEDWDYTLAGLSLINREKIDAIREAVRELENAGYIQRSRERDEKGRLRGTTYVIYEQPPKLDLPTLEKPTLDNPTLEKPTLENPTQLNKELLKTNLPKKEKLNTDISSTHSIPFRSLNPSPLKDAAQPPERKRKETEPSAFDIYSKLTKFFSKLDRRAQRVVHSAQVQKHKPMTRTSTRTSLLQESCRWWDGSRRGPAEWTAEGGLNGISPQ